MRRRAAVIAAGLLLATGAGEGVAVAAGKAFEIQTWDVGVGTRAVLVEDHRVPLVRLRIDFAAGTWSPWYRREHVQDAFEIQLRDPAARLRHRADELAADIAVTAGERVSSLTVSCRTDDLPAVLQLVRDVLANRDFDRRELARRRQARRIEWQAALKNPDFVLWQATRRAFFAPEDPRRRPWEKPDKVSTDVAALVAVRDRLVRLPGRVIGWAGDITRADADRLSRDLLPVADAPVPDDLAPRLGPVSDLDAGDGPRRETMPRLTQVYFAATRPAPGVRDPGTPALMIADHVLGGHFYSRLYQALRHEAGDTYGAATRRAADVDPGLYAAWTFTKTDNADAIRGKVRAVLARLHEAGITEDERAAAAGYLTGREAFDRQSPAQVLDRHLWELSRGLPPGYREELVRRAAALSLDEVNAFIRGFYDPDQFVMIEVHPR